MKLNVPGAMSTSYQRVMSSFSSSKAFEPARCGFTIHWRHTAPVGHDLPDVRWTDMEAEHLKVNEKLQEK